MKVTYEMSVSELKALLELLAELCKRNGIDEVVTRSLFRKLNERHFNQCSSSVNGEWELTGRQM